jgi:hypothetical protein
MKLDKKIKHLSIKKLEVNTGNPALDFHIAEKEHRRIKYEVFYANRYTNKEKYY